MGYVQAARGTGIGRLGFRAAAQPGQRPGGAAAEGVTARDLGETEAWDEAVGALPGANLYAFRPWGAYKGRLGWSVRRLAIQGDDGRPLAYAQIQQRRLGPARFLLAQGCPLLTAQGEGRAEAALGAFLDHLALGPFDLLGVNFQQFQCDEAVLALLAHGFAPVVSPRNYTLEVDLTPDMAAILAGLDAKWRRNLAKAQRSADLDAVFVTGRDERLRAFDTFRGMYAALQRRKGFSNSLDGSAFRDVAADDPRLVFLEVRERGEPVLVRIAHRAPERWTDFFAASNDRARATNAAALSVWQMMERARQEGCRLYDLGGIDPAGNRGVFDFKRGLSRRVVQSSPLWLYGRTPLLRSAAAALLARR